MLAGSIPVCCGAEQRRGAYPAFSNIKSRKMRLRELTGETRLTISGKLTREIPLATQGERRQIAAGCLAKSGAQNGQKKNPGISAGVLSPPHGHPCGWMPKHRDRQRTYIVAQMFALVKALRRLPVGGLGASNREYSRAVRVSVRPAHLQTKGRVCTRSFDA